MAAALIWEIKTICMYVAFSWLTDMYPDVILSAFSVCVCVCVCECVSAGEGQQMRQISLKQERIGYWINTHQQLVRTLECKD